MTIAYIDVAKAPVQVPVIDLLQEPQGAAFDFISGQAWIVDKVNPANTMLRNIGDVLTNPGASPTKLLRRKSGLLESAPWWANEYDLAGNPMGMRTEAQRPNMNTYSEFPHGTAAPSCTNRGGSVVASDFPALAGNTGLLFPGDGVISYAYKSTAVLPLTLYTVSVFALTEDGLPPVFDTAGGPTSGFQDFAMLIGGGAVPVANYKVEKITGPLYRVSGFATMPDTLQNNNCGIIRYAAQARRAMRFSGLQLEQAAFASSYIPTGAAAVTRAADQPQIPTGYLPYSPAAGTLILDGMAYDYDNGASYIDANNALRFSGPGGSQVDYIGMGKNDTGTRNSWLGARVRNASSGNVDTGISADKAFPVSPDPKKIALTWDGTEVIVASGVTGTTVSTPAIGWNPYTLQNLRFSLANGIMWHRSATYIPRKLTAAEMLARVRP